jgi:hypothetical protein|tara:strand:+ start:481 stop:603 length:123 start_codon:yes stop_codon:yes gene_type:complete
MELGRGETMGTSQPILVAPFATAQGRAHFAPTFEGDKYGY